MAHWKTRSTRGGCYKSRGTTAETTTGSFCKSSHVAKHQVNGIWFMECDTSQLCLDWRNIQPTWIPDQFLSKAAFPEDLELRQAHVPLPSSSQEDRGENCGIIGQRRKVRGNERFKISILGAVLERNKNHTATE